MGRLNHRVRRIERALTPPAPRTIPFTKRMQERAEHMVARWQADPIGCKSYLDSLEEARRELAVTKEFG